MPGGGQIALVSVGTHNNILNGNRNPDFTYFYMVFKKHSHFSFENVTLPLEGPNELQYDQQIKLRAKIQRVTDLMADMSLVFRLPDIYSKYITPSQTRQAQYEFQWAHYLGAHIIQNVGFYVGGAKIQEFDGDYMIAKAHQDYDMEQLTKWKQLVGETPELTNPSQGMWAGGETATGYPSVVRDTSRNQQFNRPSIFGQDLRVPLPFWFSETFTKALPLVALNYHECEVQVTLRPIQELYTILDPSGYRVRPGYRVDPSGNALLSQNPNLPKYVSNYDISGEFRSFVTDIGYTPPQINTWYFNPRIEATYIYLTDDERRKFATTPIFYIVPQVTMARFPNLFNQTTLDLEFANPATRLLLVPRRSDSLPYRNAVENFSNWWNYPLRPWLPTPGATIPQNKIVSSGLLLNNCQPQIFRTLRVLLDGNELQEEKPIEFYIKQAQYRYAYGGFSRESDYLPMIPFALKSDVKQPSGSLNRSAIKKFQLDVNPWPLAPNTTYIYDLNIYIETVNFFVVMNGFGGTKFANG